MNTTAHTTESSTDATTAPLPKRRPRRRSVGAALAAAGLAVAFAGCDLIVPVTPLAPPTEPVRYHQFITGTADVTSDVAYGSALDYAGNPVTLRADVYAPTGDPETNRPLVIFVHGGGWSSGSKSDQYEVSDATAFAKAGFVVASVDYRLRPAGFDPTNWTDPTTAAVITDARHDVQAAVRFFRANAATYGVDATRIALVGRDAGATTALGVGFRADDPGSSGNPGPSSAVNAVVSISGGSDTAAIDATDAPFMMVHGADDAVISVSLAQATCDAAQSAGLPCGMRIFENSGHDLDATAHDNVVTQTLQTVTGALSV